MTTPLMQSREHPVSQWRLEPEAPDEDEDEEDDEEPDEMSS